MHTTNEIIDLFAVAFVYLKLLQNRIEQNRI